MLTTILGILGALIPTILQNRGIIGASTDQLITGLTTQGVTLLQNLGAATTKTQDGLAALAAAAGVIAVLKSTTGLPADVLTVINDVDADVQAALKNYALAGNGLNLALYTQVAEVA